MTTLPATTTVIAYYEHRVEAIFVPHRSMVEFIASAMVRPEGRWMRPVEEFLSAHCIAFDEARPIESANLHHDRGVYARISVLDGCPKGTDHLCREQDRPMVLAALEGHITTD